MNFGSSSFCVISTDLAKVRAWGFKISNPSEISTLIFSSLLFTGKLSLKRLLQNYQATTGKTLNTQFVSQLLAESFASTYCKSPEMQEAAITQKRRCKNAEMLLFLAQRDEWSHSGAISQLKKAKLWNYFWPVPQSWLIYSHCYIPDFRDDNKSSKSTRGV